MFLNAFCLVLFMARPPNLNSFHVTPTFFSTLGRRITRITPISTRTITTPLSSSFNDDLPRDARKSDNSDKNDPSDGSESKNPESESTIDWDASWSKVVSGEVSL